MLFRSRLLDVLDLPLLCDVDRSRSCFELLLSRGRSYIGLQRGEPQSAEELRLSSDRRRVGTKESGEEDVGWTQAGEGRKGTHLRTFAPSFQMLELLTSPPAILGQGGVMGVVEVQGGAQR